MLSASDALEKFDIGVGKVDTITGLPSAELIALQTPNTLFLMAGTSLYRHLS